MKKMLCNSLASVSAMQNPKIDVIQSRLRTLSAALIDSQQLDKNGLNNCMDVLVGTIHNYSSLLCVAGKFQDSVSLVSQVIQNTDSEWWRNTLSNAIDSLAVTCQSTLATNENPLTIVSDSVRLLTAMSSVQSLSSSASFQLPQSEYHKIQQLPTVSVHFGKFTAPAAETAAISLSEFNVDKKSATSNSSVVNLNITVAVSIKKSTSAKSKNRRRLAIASGYLNTSFVMILQNKESITYNHLSPKSSFIRCTQLSDKSYDVKVSCPDEKVYAVSCPANIRGSLNVTCPGYQEVPVCLQWNGASFVESSFCEVIHYTNSNTSCRCSSLQQNSSLIVTLSSSVVVVRQNLHYEFEVNKDFTVRESGTVIIVSLSVIYGFLIVVILSINIRNYASVSNSFDLFQGDKSASKSTKQSLEIIPKEDISQNSLNNAAKDLQEAPVSDHQDEAEDCNSAGFVLNDIEDFEVSSNSDGFIHRHFEAIPQVASDFLDANALSVESVHNDNESVVPDNNDVIAELPHEPIVVSDSNTTRVDGHHHSNNGAEDSHSAVCKPLPEAAMGSFKTRIVSEYLDSFIPSEFRHRTFPRQILEVVIPHHFLFNWWRSVRCAIGTFSHLLAVLFFASLLAYSEYADDGQCEALSLETACVSPKSVLFGRPKCQWSPGSQYCGVDVPAAQPATLLQLAALIVLASVLCSLSRREASWASRPCARDSPSRPAGPGRPPSGGWSVLNNGV